MAFDPNNKVIQICIQGMTKEAEGNQEEAKLLFLEAWSASTNDFEKFTSAHYVARHQNSVNDKLEWDKKALTFALQIEDDTMKAHFPSLYLNIAKCHEDLNDTMAAEKNYQLAQSYMKFLPADGYGKMIKAGITNGLERLSSK